MKTILLAVFLVAVSVVPTHAQYKSDPFMQGVWMAIEANRAKMENRMAEQQIELMKQQRESMKETRREYTNELFQKGFQEGHAAGYKKGIDDIVDYVKKTDSQIQTNILNFVGNEVFNETSTEKLAEARKIFLLSLNTPNHYIARLYITLIDARLEELKQKHK